MSGRGNKGSTGVKFLRKARVNDDIMDERLWSNYNFKVGERWREKRSLGDEETSL